MRPRAGGEEEERVHLRAVAVDQKLAVARRMLRVARRIPGDGQQCGIRGRRLRP